MADSVSTPRASGLGLRFIEDDPVTNAYRDSEKFDLAQRTGEAGLVGKNLENEYHGRSMGSRLRQVDAQADTARAGADVATQTVPAHVSQAYSAARTAGAGADVAEGTVQPRISQAQSAARSASTSAELGERELPYKVQSTEAGARTATSGANVSEQTEPARVQQANAQGRQADATALHAEMQNFHDVITMANAGDIQGAHALAERSGQKIPPGLLENADVRAALTAASTKAQALYPNRPADQQRYIHGFMESMATRRAEGGAANAPGAVHEMPAGAPNPVEQAGTHKFDYLPSTRTGPDGKPEQGYLKVDKASGTEEFVAGTTIQSKTGAGGGGRASVFQLKQQAWLAAHPGDEQGALDYAGGRRQMNEGDIAKSAIQMARAELNANAMMKYKKPEEQNAFIQQRAAEIAGQLRTGIAPPAGAAPAAPAARPAQPAPRPQAPAAAPAAPAAAAPPPGMGTRDQPFQATTQDHINWFKQSAPPGSVLDVGGTLYTK